MKRSRASALRNHGSRLVRAAAVEQSRRARLSATKRTRAPAPRPPRRVRGHSTMTQASNSSPLARWIDEITSGGRARRRARTAPGPTLIRAADLGGPDRLPAGSRVEPLQEPPGDVVGRERPGNPTSRRRASRSSSWRSRRAASSREHGRDPAGDRPVGRAAADTMVDAVLVQPPGQQQRGGVVAAEHRDVPAKHRQQSGELLELAERVDLRERVARRARRRRWRSSSASRTSAMRVGELTARAVVAAQVQSSRPRGRSSSASMKPRHRAAPLVVVDRLRRIAERREPAVVRLEQRLDEVGPRPDQILHLVDEDVSHRRRGSSSAVAAPDKLGRERDPRVEAAPRPTVVGRVLGQQPRGEGVEGLGERDRERMRARGPGAGARARRRA